MNCQYCDCQISDSAVNCSNCGAPVDRDLQKSNDIQQETINYSEHKSRKSRALFIILSVLPGVGLLGINNFYSGHYIRGFLKIAFLISGFFAGKDSIWLACVVSYIWCIVEVFAVKADANKHHMSWFN